MSIVTEQLKQWDIECRNVINEGKTRANKVMDDIQDTFKKNVIRDIQKDFGDYIYNALGSKINSQRKSIINMPYVIAQDWIKEAKDKNVDIEKFLADRPKQGNGWGSYYRRKYQQVFTHITTGKQFGFSYYTNTGKLYTMWINADNLFHYLTQEHVDLISNKDKRRCAQEFLNLRDNFIAKLTPLYQRTIDVDIHVKTAKVSCIAIKDKFCPDGYDHDYGAYYILDDERTDTINRIYIKTDNIIQYDRTVDLDKNNFTFGGHVIPHVELVAYKINKDEAIIFGDFAYSYDNCKSGITTWDLSNTHTVCNFTNINGLNGSRNIVNTGCKKMSSYAVLDWDKILTDPAVKSAIDDIVNFYNTASKALHTLKQRHGGLIFIHGCF